MVVGLDVLRLRILAMCAASSAPAICAASSRTTPTGNGSRSRRRFRSYPARWVSYSRSSVSAASKRVASAVKNCLASFQSNGMRMSGIGSRSASAKYARARSR
jgi:hypothetical protein